MTHLSLHRTRTVTGVPRRVSLLGLLLAAINVRRSRDQLNTLDARQLEDIGVTRNAAETEATRPLWDVPAHWLK